MDTEFTEYMNQYTNLINQIIQNGITITTDAEREQLNQLKLIVKQHKELFEKYSK